MTKPLYNLYDMIKVFFKRNKQLIAIIFFVIILGFFVGLFCVVKKDSFLISKIPDFAIRIYLKNFNWFYYFLIKCLETIALLVIFYFISFLKLGKIILLIFSFYLSSCLGVTVAILYNYYSPLQGLVLCLIYFLFEFLIYLILFLLFSILCFRNREVICYGSCSYKIRNINLILPNLIVIISLILIEAFAIFLTTKIFFIN